MESQTDIGKVVIISTSDGFLAKSLITKLERIGIKADFSHADIKELEKHTEEMELAILFMSEELEEMPETLVFLKDTLQEKERGLILIGEEQQYDFVKKTIPSQLITEYFKRPLDIDKLMKSY